MAAKTPARPERVPPRLRRAYYECRFGQLHLHNAIPSGGGFDELTALLCIHGSGTTGRAFQDLLADLGFDRSVYAPDLPGAGESDPPGATPATDAAVDALQDFLDTMRIREVDLVALGDGAVIARRLAVARPRNVRKVVLMAEAGGAAGTRVTQPLLALTQDEAQAPGRNARIADFLGGRVGPVP